MCSITFQIFCAYICICVCVWFDVLRCSDLFHCVLAYLFPPPPPPILEFYIMSQVGHVMGVARGGGWIA